MKLKFLLFSALINLIFLLSCTSQKDTESPLAAKVGPEKISVEDVERSFYLNPQYQMRTTLRRAFNSQLRFLIQDKFHLLAARKADLEKDPAVQKRLKYIREQETIKTYLNEKFINAVTVSETELIRELAKLNKQVSVQHLFAETREKAQELQSRLEAGADFEELAEEIYSDIHLKESGGYIGSVGYGDLDVNLENKIFEMEAGEISGPVKSSYGYHILKVLEIQNDASPSLQNDHMKISLVQEVMRRRKVDEAIRAHLDELAGGQKIQVNNRILDILYSATWKTMEQKYSDMNVFQTSINDRELSAIQSDIFRIQDEVVLKFCELEMKTGEFLERLKEMPPYHRPYLNTKSRLAQTMIDIIRNDLLLDAAQTAGFDRHPATKEAVREKIDEFIAGEFYRRISMDEYAERYQKILTDIQKKYPAIIYDDRISTYAGLSDTLMAPAPIPIFLKNRYIW